MSSETGGSRRAPRQRQKDINDIEILRGPVAEADTQPNDLAASDGEAPFGPPHK